METLPVRWQWRLEQASRVGSKIAKSAEHQLLNLEADPAKETNRVDEHPGRVSELMELLKIQVTNGRCTSGVKLSTDRKVVWLPSRSSTPPFEDL